MNELLWNRPFLWPWLLALPVLWAMLDRSRRAAAQFGATTKDVTARPLWRSLRLTVLVGLSLCCWMDPRLGDEEVTVERRGLDLIFCLDTSRSMLARDLEPTRLQRAIADITAVLPRLQGGDRVGIVVFAGQARLWVPLTHDLDSFRGLLSEIDTNVVPVGGTDLAAALRRAGEVADKDNLKTTVVVLLTDGEDLAGAGQQAAGELAGRGILVHAVGYGSAAGSKITVTENGNEAFLRSGDGQEVVSHMDERSLRELAKVTAGEFVRADAMPLPLVELHGKRLLPMQKRAYDAGTEQGKKARYQWVLLPLLLLLLYEIATSGGRRA